ncbi:MAG: hypothetical protein ACREJQ_04915, partial [bacterium]
MNKRGASFTLLLACLTAFAGCNKPDLRALNKPVAKGKPSAIGEKMMKPAAVAVIGFSSETDPGNNIWVGYGLSYFVADKLRLDPSRVLVSPNEMADIMPDVDTRLFSREPPSDILMKFKDLLKV